MTDTKISILNQSKMSKKYKTLRGKFIGSKIIENSILL